MLLYNLNNNAEKKSDFMPFKNITFTADDLDFIENLRKGTYTYEYDLKITVKGSLQLRPARATCYYAPSFSANTKGERFVIRKK